MNGRNHGTTCDAERHVALGARADDLTDGMAVVVDKSGEVDGIDLGSSVSNLMTGRDRLRTLPSASIGKQPTCRGRELPVSVARMVTSRG